MAAATHTAIDLVVGPAGPEHAQLARRIGLDTLLEGLKRHHPPAIALCPADDAHSKPGHSLWHMVWKRQTGPGQTHALVVLRTGDPDNQRLSDWLNAEEGPYVVFPDAQSCLAALRRHDLEALVPRRFGCVRVAATLLAAGADGLKGHRSFKDIVRCHLHARPEGPKPEAASTDRWTSWSSQVLEVFGILTQGLRAQRLMPVFELECAVVPAIVDMEALGMHVDVARFERIAQSWRERARSEPESELGRRLTHLSRTYGPWPREYIDLDGRIRCHLHPLGTDSGRISCTQPNLQQVPSEHTAPGLRSCFCAADGYELVIADYAQIELRVAAHIADCPGLRAAFAAGEDPHTSMAAHLTGRTRSEVSPHERKLAKAVNFGFLFGMGARRFQSYALRSYGLEVDEASARRAKAAFESAYPGVARWHQRTKKLAHTAPSDAGDITVKTVMGRQRRFAPDQFSYNAALNIPVQGTAAEGFKSAMIELHSSLPAHAARGVMCVHDEYIAEVPSDRAAVCLELIRATMQRCMAALVTSVPITVEAHRAPAWGPIAREDMNAIGRSPG